jgi:hypothetical protein
MFGTVFYQSRDIYKAGKQSALHSSGSRVGDAKRIPCRLRSKPRHRRATRLARPCQWQRPQKKTINLRRCSIKRDRLQRKRRNHRHGQAMSLLRKRKPAENEPTAKTARTTRGGPDSQPAIQLTAAAPVPELSPLIPTSTQVCAATVATVKEPGNITRSFPTAGVGAPNTPVAETGKQTVTAVGEQPAPEQGHPADLFAAAGSCPPTPESVRAQSANPAASPKIEPELEPPKDQETVLPQLSISNRQAERAATSQTQGDFAHEVAKSPESIAAPAQGLPAVAPPRCRESCSSDRPDRDGQTESPGGASCILGTALGVTLGPRERLDREAREPTPSRSGYGHARSETDPGDGGT